MYTRQRHGRIVVWACIATERARPDGIKTFWSGERLTAGDAERAEAGLIGRRRDGRRNGKPQSTGAKFETQHPAATSPSPLARGWSRRHCQYWRNDRTISLVLISGGGGGVGNNTMQISRKPLPPPPLCRYTFTAVVVYDGRHWYPQPIYRVPRRRRLQREAIRVYVPGHRLIGPAVEIATLRVPPSARSVRIIQRNYFYALSGVS